MTDSVITSKHMNVQYDWRTVLNDISIDIPRGAVVGLVGRNGAGKSTFLRSLVGLVEPSWGESALFACPSLDLTDAVRERLGFVAQSPDLFEWMEVFEHLQTIGRAYSNWNEERCLLLAARLDLRMGCSVNKLSGGDKQKLAVILALAHDPDLLILDEPVSSLDPMIRREFMRSLFASRTDENNTESADKQRTIIISSHLLNDLERVVTHVAFMREGRLQLFDTWDAMLEHLRLIPLPADDLPKSAVICKNKKASQCVIDTRLAPEWSDTGRVLSLDELFVELNS